MYSNLSSTVFNKNKQTNQNSYLKKRNNLNTDLSEPQSTCLPQSPPLGCRCRSPWSRGWPRPVGGGRSRGWRGEGDKLEISSSTSSNCSLSVLEKLTWAAWLGATFNNIYPTFTFFPKTQTTNRLQLWSINIKNKLGDITYNNTTNSIINFYRGFHNNIYYGNRFISLYLYIVAWILCHSVVRTCVAANLLRALKHFWTINKDCWHCKSWWNVFSNCTS